jgi:hypothetical protein
MTHVQHIHGDNLGGGFVKDAGGIDAHGRQRSLDGERRCRVYLETRLLGDVLYDGSNKKALAA